MIDLTEHPEKYNDIVSEHDDTTKTVCLLCGSKYKERPFLCLCRSNVFLRDVK